MGDQAQEALHRLLDFDEALQRGEVEKEHEDEGLNSEDMPDGIFSCAPSYDREGLMIDLLRSENTLLRLSQAKEKITVLPESLVVALKTIAYQNDTQPICPRCSKEMKRVSGKNGEFWGCSKFPVCKGNVSIDKRLPDALITKAQALLSKL